MNPLYLDIGNSFLKLAERKGDDWNILFEGELHRFDKLCAHIRSIGKSKKIVLSSVRKDVTEKLRENFDERVIHELKTSDIPTKMLDYKTPHTLGLDRFLVCLAAWKESEGNDIVVVDAGSACTVDLMTNDGVYRGGVIMPGLQLVRDAMKERLPELPGVSESIPDEWPGRSTTECIEWGVNGGFLMTVQGFIHQYRRITENPESYITGGNAKQLVEWMDEEESLVYRKHLIWDGLEELAKIVQI